MVIRPDPSALVSATASAGGTVLRGVFTAAARLRPAAKPLHPRGQLHRGVLRRTGATPPFGSAWLDGSGADEVLVRLSRSAGLPAPLPDVLGLAVRVPVAPGRVGDLLFSTTGRGRLSRFVLLPRRDPGATYGTLLPYCTSTGTTVLLAAWGAPGAEQGGRTWTLAAATPGGPWREFAQLHLDTRPLDEEPDPSLSFDPVLNSVPGLTFPDWVSALREGSYSAARHVRTGGRPDQSLGRSPAPDRDAGRRGPADGSADGAVSDPAASGAGSPNR